eukprot:gnl/TRDRNA2_/TRDRNA2_157512_c0_seq2.p1 gnl/TRDRNA2_/TRDRNA2_157512_c0~~gnl/TRDRNA2_/TRDRNA2_157512_c0_seq2.p1  ORF type:complete len:291 (+),score=31.16 gnl/TRDRNA2_/TRDRNA2_157512_c0_seq2:99-971(+)
MHNIEVRYHRISSNGETSGLIRTGAWWKLGIALVGASCFVLLTTIMVWGSDVSSAFTTHRIPEPLSLVSLARVNAGGPASSAHLGGVLQSQPGILSTRHMLLRSHSTHAAEREAGSRGGIGIRSCCHSRSSTLRSAAVDPSNCKDVRDEALSVVELPPFGEDDEKWLAFMIARYLDDEWTKLDVHDRIGAAAGKLYREARATGENDLTFVHLQMISGLEEIWKSEGFKEAFEGPCDIANRAAEFLMLKIGREVWSYGQSNEQMNEKLRERMKLFEAEQKSSSASAEPGTK